MRYGYHRVYLQLRNERCILNHKTVQNLMCGMHLKLTVRKIRYRSYKGTVGKIAPNIIARNFVALTPNKKWATDITEFKIHDIKAYLSPILDRYNGEIIAYTLSDHPI